MCKAFQPEPMSLGGITNTLAVAHLALAHGSWIAPHQSGGPVATAVCLQLAAGVPNFLIQEHFTDSFLTMETLDAVVTRMELTVQEIPKPALFLAGKAFARYLRRGGSKTQVLPDFLIGAHAAVQGWPLLTRDASRFRTYFPGMEVLAP